MDHHRISIRLLVGVAAFSVVTAGCASTDSISSTSSQAEILAPPPLTAQDEAKLSAEALTSFCSQKCTGSDMYVHDSIFTATTLAGNEKPMPEATREAIAAAFPDAVFVTMEEADALFGDDALVDGGKGMLISIGPIRFLRDDVIGIDIGEVTARDGGFGRTEQFLWTGETWEPTDSSVTGVTTTSWVS
jgi:hypothetical protein